VEGLNSGLAKTWVKSYPEITCGLLSYKVKWLFGGHKREKYMISGGTGKL